MVIINRNDLSIQNMSGVKGRNAMQDRTVSGHGAKVSPAGFPSPRPCSWPLLAESASSSGSLATGYPVQSTGTREPTAEATRLESKVHPFRQQRFNQHSQDSFQRGTPATTAQS